MYTTLYIFYCRHKIDKFAIIIIIIIPINYKIRNRFKISGLHVLLLETKTKFSTNLLIIPVPWSAHW